MNIPRNLPQRLAPRPSWLTWATVLAALLSALALLAGCAGMAGVQPRSRTLLAAEQAGADAQAAVPVWPRDDWWAAWGDAQLSGLVTQALAQQPGLQTAQARLEQARAAAGIASAARSPVITGSVDLSDQRFTEHGLVPPPLAGTTHWNNTAQLNATWELDVFGRQRAALDAALGRVRAAQADTQAARVLLAANTVAAYWNLAQLVDARALAEQALRQRQQVRALVQQRIGAGLDTSVDLRQAEGLVAQTEVDIEALADAIAHARHALAELTGQGPYALNALAPQLAQVHATPLPTALPADLLGRRADLVAQRWRVEAALHDADAIRAQFYPNINLVAFFGLQSLGLDQFINAGSRAYGAGPAVRLPVFDGGRLRSALSAQNAEADVAVDAYNTALLRALREVADAVGTLQSLERQQLAQTQALQSAEAAFDLAVQRYRAGLGNFLVVLTAEGNALAQRRAASELKARHLGAQTQLARSLGGGYMQPQDEASGLASAFPASADPHTSRPPVSP